MINKSADVLIIGAGPSGSLAAAILCRAGYSVSVFERAKFPRFCIGESLLPQSMVFLAKGGAVPIIEQAGFQLKNGAVFQCGARSSSIDFSEKFTAGPSQTFEVQRARFDSLLAEHAIECGAKIYFEHSVQSYQDLEDGACLEGEDSNGDHYTACGKFVLDASGYGRVLPTLLGLEKPSSFPVKKAIFTHLRDNIAHPAFDRNKILITIHHSNPEIWYWLIPFSDGTSSIGVVGSVDDIDAFGKDDDSRLKALIYDDQHYRKIMPAPDYIRIISSITGYSCGVKKLYGKNYALLGNAGEFIDPIFSSGVTIAFKSADLAANLLCRQLQGETIDWEQEYAASLMVGVNTFKAFVESWYEGTLQKVILDHPEEDSEIKRMIISILAGYAWDEANPFVRDGKRLLSIVADRFS